MLVGAPPLEGKLELDPLVLFGIREKKLMGCFLGSCNSLRDIPRMIAMWRAGQLDLEALVTARRPLDDINDAFTDLAAGVGIRTVIDLVREHLSEPGTSGEDRTADGAGLTPVGPGRTLPSTTMKPSGLGASPDRRWPGRSAPRYNGGH